MTEGAIEGDNEIGRAGRALPSFFAEGGGLAYPVAKEVQSGAASVAVARDLDLLDARGVHEEGALDPDTRGDPPDGDLLVDAAIAHAEDGPFELLEALAIAFDHAHAYGHRVTRPDLWEIGLLLLGGKRLQDVVHRHGDGCHGVAQL